METGDTFERQPKGRRKRASSRDKSSEELHSESREDLIDVISSLRKENVCLQEELACSIKERDSLKKVMEKYDFKLAKLKDETYKLRDEIQDEKAENEELRKNLKKLKKKSKLKETPDDATMKLGEQEEKGCDHNCDCNQTKNSVDKNQESEVKEDKDKEHVDMDEGESELQRVIDDMTEECRMRQDSIDELEEELEEKAAVIDDLKHQIENLENSLSKFEEDQNQNTDRDNATKIDELNYTVTEMEDRLEEMSNEKQKLLKRIQDLETCLAEQDLELAVEDIEGVSPRSANSALRILKTQYLRLRNEHSSVAKENSHLQEENDLLKKEIERNFSPSDEEIPMSLSSNFCSYSDSQQQQQCHGNGQQDKNMPSNQETTAINLSESFIRNYEELQKELNKNREELDKLTMLHREAVQEKNKTEEYVHLLQAQNADLDLQNNSFTQNLEGLMRDKTELQRKVNNLQLQLQTSQTTNSVSEQKTTNSTPVTNSTPEVHQGSITTNRISTKVRDLVKFHENIVNDMGDTHRTKNVQEENNSSQIPRPRLEPWPSGKVSVSQSLHDSSGRISPRLRVKSSPELNSKIMDQQRNLNERWQSTEDLRGKKNESMVDVSRNNSISTMGRNPFLSAENYKEVVNALSALKLCAEQLEAENETLNREIASIDQKYEWRLNLARLQQERSDLLYNSLLDEHQKLESMMVTRNGSAFGLSCYYKELVNQIEYEKEKLHDENFTLKMGLKQLEDSANVNLENLKEAIKNVNREKQLQQEEHKKQLQKKDLKMRDFESVFAKLQKQNVKLVAKVKDQEEEISSLNVVLDRYELEEMNENEEEGEEEEEEEIFSEMAESSFGGRSGDIRNPFAPEVIDTREDDGRYYSPIPTRFRTTQLKTSSK